MHNVDEKRITSWYSGRFRQFGYGPDALGWGKGGRQQVRFKSLCEIGDLNGKRILDVGCGFGDMYGYLSERGWQGEYCGLDLVEEFITEGKARYKNAEFIVGDFDKTDFPHDFDYIMASGIFNLRLENEDNWGYTMRVLKKMHFLAKAGIAVDFMTTWVDWEQPSAFHTDPSELINRIRPLTNRFIIRQDYMPYEFTLYIYKNNEKLPDNTFGNI